MAYFILSNFWPVFNFFFRPAGIYPCKRIGDAQLQVTTGCQFWFRYVATSILLFSIFGGTIGYIFTCQTSYELLMEILSKTIGTSALDIAVVIWMNATAFITFSAYLTNIRSSTMKLKDLQDLVNAKSFLQITIGLQLKLQAYFKSISWAIIFFSSISLSWIFILQQINNDPLMKEPLSGFWGMALIFCYVSIQAILSLPFFYFLLLFIELYVLLYSWYQSIIEINPSELFLKEVNHYMKGLRCAKSIISPFLFWTTSMFFSQVILLTYYIFAFITVNSGPWESYEIGSITAYVLFVMAYVYLLYINCFMSEEIVSRVQSLKIKIIETDPRIDNREILYSSLSEFQGFDGNGYFTLNNSLLTGMVASFTTYLVILIQFKQSE